MRTHAARTPSLALATSTVVNVCARSVTTGFVRLQYKRERQKKKREKKGRGKGGRLTSSCSSQRLALMNLMPWQQPRHRPAPPRPRALVLLQPWRRCRWCVRVSSDSRSLVQNQGSFILSTTDSKMAQSLSINSNASKPSSSVLKCWLRHSLVSKLRTSDVWWTVPKCSCTSTKFSSMWDIHPHTQIVQYG
jgi:hypothetical protein